MSFIAPGKASALSGVFYGVEFESKKKVAFSFCTFLSYSYLCRLKYEILKKRKRFFPTHWNGGSFFEYDLLYIETNGSGR